MIFKTDTKTGGKSLTVQHDAHVNGAPWVKNETAVNGKPAPMYAYKTGLTVDDTPRPYMDQVEPITDYTSFKAGDRLPFVVGIRDAVWGGSKDDIRTKGTTDGKTWMVEFSRLLDTGNPDDITLVPGKDATFIIIIRDDGKGYATSAPVTLRFE